MLSHRHVSITLDEYEDTIIEAEISDEGFVYISKSARAEIPSGDGFVYDLVDHIELDPIAAIRLVDFLKAAL